MYTSTRVLGERLEGDITRRLTRTVELGDGILNSSERVELLPLPCGVHVCREDTVPCLRERCVLVTDKAMESRSGTLQNSQANERALDLDTFLSAHSDLDISGLLAILGKAVRVRLAINLKTRPANSLDTDVGNVNVLVLLNEVAAEDRGVQLRRVDGVLLGGNVDGVLDRVGGNDNTVIGLGV